MSHRPGREAKCRSCTTQDLNACPGCKVAEHAARLTACGYRRVSAKYRLVARIDRADWSASAQNADFYRRCTSKDSLEVPKAVYARMLPSRQDPTGFIEVERCPHCGLSWPTATGCLRCLKTARQAEQGGLNAGT